MMSLISTRKNIVQKLILKESNHSECLWANCPVGEWINLETESLGIN